MALHESLPQKTDTHSSNGAAEPRGQFGRYLLFKVLKRDALGESYRAGQIGSSAIERVVSLRLFNGAGIDGERFWQACQDRQELKSALCGGPFGEVVDSGFDEGVCYVAHEYVFGRSLAEMLDQARETSCPIPIEHALHILDRLAMSLHNANGIRLEGKRVSHGFLVPAFVQLSSEGEVRLTGFDSTGGILDLASDGAVRSQFAGYTSPEVNQGKSPTGADDVYSMGVIFYELLTGDKLPPITESGASQWIDAGVVADEGAPLPDEIRQLLHQSLAPRDQRIQSAELFHRELAKITSAGEHSPTTFNLAFFMHTLFGEELDRELQTVEAEKKEPVRTQTTPAPAPISDVPSEIDAAVEAAVAAVEVAAPAPIEAAPLPPQETRHPVDPVDPLAETVSIEDLSTEADDDATPDHAAARTTHEDSIETSFGEALELEEDVDLEEDLLAEPAATAASTTTQARTQSAPDADSRRRLFAAIAVAAVVGVIALGVFVFDLPIPGMGDSSGEALTVAAAPRIDEVAAMEAADPTADPTAAELPEVAPPLSPGELQTQVRSLVAERAGDMEKDLKAEYDERLVELRTQLEGARQATAKPEETGPGEAEANAPAEPQEQSAPRQTPEARSAEPQVESTPPGSAAVRLESPEKPVEAEPGSQAAASAAPAIEAPEPVAADPEAAEKVEPGSIVEQGVGVTAPRLVRQPSVVYPSAAVRLKREASVRVRILVDEEGRPSEIEQIGPKIGIGFDQAAMRAAKSTRWTAPTKGEVPVKMWVELTVEFRP